MISERIFATSFPDFWQELLPLLTPSCVHLLNIGYEVPICDVNGINLDHVEICEDSRASSIVTEFAYHLAREAFSRGMSVHDAIDEDSVRHYAQQSAFDLINSYEGKHIQPDFELNRGELNEGLQLAIRYELFAKIFGGAQRCLFQTSLKGSGFLHSCNTDLIIDDFLIEVKTVKRTLAGKDIRQLVVYLALGSQGQSTQFQYAGFFNPRRSSFHRFQVRELIELMSGGKSAIEVYNELLDFTCSSDVQLDSVF